MTLTCIVYDFYFYFFILEIIKFKFKIPNNKFVNLVFRKQLTVKTFIQVE